MSTSTALEFMPFPVGGFGVPAARATFAGASRIDFDDRHAVRFRLVANEEGELTVGPFVDLASNLLAQAFPTDAVQRFNRDDRTSGLIGKGNDRLRHFVVDGLHEPLLPAGQPFERLGDRSRPTLCLSPLERRADTQITVANMLSVPAFAHPVAFAVCGAGENIDAAIDTDDGIVRARTDLDILLERQGEENAFAGDDQPSVSEHPALDLVAEIRRARERHSFDAAIDRPDRQTGSAQGNIAPACAALQDHSLGVEPRRSGEDMLIGPCRGVFAGDVPDAGRGNLSGEPASARNVIAELVKPDGVGETSVLESNPTDCVARISPRRNRSSRDVDRQVDLQFDCAGYFRHKTYISDLPGFVNSNEKGANSPVS